MPVIHFETKLFKIGSSTILLLPKDASAKLPSRGMVLVEGTVNGTKFLTPLEPDGRGSHWLRADKILGQTADGDSVTVELEPSKDWPEPTLPIDFKKALAADPEASDIWADITPMARWDWLRWIASTNREETRKKHVVVALSKMKAGTRRPCCFNRALCCEPAVSKGGLLLEPTQMTK
jgi:hypothetical protein